MEGKDLPGAKVVLLDIEGTTTPIDFVHKTLFDYARENTEEFLKRSYGDPEVRNIVFDLNKLHEQSGKDRKPEVWDFSGSKKDIDAAAEFCRWLISIDSKAGPLKALQGLVWEEGFRSGMLSGVVYPDVPAAMQRWREQGRRICIYSSGSTRAQKLIFGSTQQGDLTKHLNCFYDTAVGNKREAQSYRNIAEKEGIPAENFLFLSDVREELDAAQEAGMMVMLVVRGSSAVENAPGIGIVHDFEGIFP